ncbi:hypothetical protein ACVWYN_000160 [Pedobacter sp. UYP24]
MLSGFVFFVFVKWQLKGIYSFFRYTNDAEPIADGYRMDNRRTNPGRRQVLPRPNPGTFKMSSHVKGALKL